MNARQILLLLAVVFSMPASRTVHADQSAAAASAAQQTPRDAAPTVGKPEESMQDMSGMEMPAMQGGRAPPDARDPDYSAGQSMSAMPGMGDSMHDDMRFGKFVVDQLEFVHDADASGVAIDAQAAYGSDVDKLWLKLDGERTSGHLRDTRTQALWDHAASAFWDTQLGVRHDFGAGPARTWAAFGVQGLAPYWLNIEATAYLGQSGRSAVRVEAEYDVLLTQQLIVTPDLEVNAYGKNDLARHIGSGVSNAELGLRLRYEITRRFAPYVGIDWNRRIGNTAELVRAAGEPAFDRQIVAGVRIWF